MKKLYKKIWIQAAVNGPEATAGNPNGLRCFLYKRHRDLGKKRKLLPLKIVHFKDQNGNTVVTLKFKRHKDGNGLIGWNEAHGSLEIKNGVGTFTVLH